jgi:hypothetical protein
LLAAATGLKAAAATLGPSQVGTRYESFGVLTGAVGELIRWGVGIREADPHSERFRGAARQLAKDVLSKGAGEDHALREAAANIRDLNEPEDVGLAVDALLAVSLPLPIFVEHMPADVADPDSGESDLSLIVAFVAFTLDGQPLVTPTTVEPNVLHDLEVELRLSAWPDGAAELVLDVLTVEEESDYRMPRFTFARPGGAGPYHLRANDRLRLNVPQTLRSRPLEFAYRAQFLPQQPKTRVVVEGQRHVVLRSFDPEQHPITGYRVVDRRLIEILGELRHQVGIPDREMDDFMLILSALGGIAGQSLPVQDRLLHLADRLGDLDLARAGLGAVEDRAAAPDALAVVQDLQPLGRRLVAAVEDEAVRVHDRRRADEVLVRPERRARGGARRAQDALGGVVEALAVLDRLQPLALRRAARR